MKGNRRLIIAVTVSVLFACVDPEAPAVSSTQEPVVICASGPTVSGIDVSKWQGDIDWEAVRRSDMAFAFARVSDGLDYPDAYFHYNWWMIAEQGLVRGVYQFFRPNRDPVAQADLLIDAVGELRAGDLPPVIDIEVTGGKSPDEIVAGALAWIDRVETRLGVTPIVYTGRYFWENEVASHPGLADYLLWIPHWQADCPNIPEPWNEWAFFQFTESGSVDGVDGPVDVNYFNGDIHQLRELTVGGDICSPIGEQGALIDDQNVCFEALGRMEEASGSGIGGSFRYAKTTDVQAAEVIGQWNLELEAAGTFTVSVHAPASHALSRQARYQIAHGKQVTEKTVDQRGVDGWIDLGEITFAAGGNQWIRLSSFTGESSDSDVTVVFDAVRLTPTTDEPPDDEDGEVPSVAPEPSGGGGCSAGGDASHWALVILLLSMLAIRRRRANG